MSDNLDSTGVPLDQDEMEDPGSNSDAPDPLIGEQAQSGALSKVTGSKADQQDRASASRAGMADLRKQYADTAGQASDAYASQRKTLEDATNRLLGIQAGPSPQEQAYRIAAAVGTGDSRGSFNPAGISATHADILKEQREAEMQKNQLLSQYGMQIPQTQLAAANQRLNQITQQMRIQQSDINNSENAVNKGVQQKNIGTTGMVYNPAANNGQGGYEYHQEIADAANAQKKTQAQNASAIKIAQQKAIAGGQFTPQELDLLADTWTQNPQALGSLGRSGAIVPVIKAAMDKASANGDNAGSIIAQQQLTKAQAGVLQDFTKGATAKSLDGLNTSVMHAGVLEKLIPLMDNTQSPAYNQVANWVKTQMGESAPVEFNTVRDFLAGEVAKAVLPQGGGEREREGIAAAMKASNSPPQLQKALADWKQLLAGKTDATRLRWDQWTGGKYGDFNDKFLLPPTKTALGITPPQAPQQGRTAPPQVQAPAVSPLATYYQALGKWKAAGSQGPAPAKPAGI
jgi:hypothetical protein